MVFEDVEMPDPMKGVSMIRANISQAAALAYIGYKRSKNTSTAIDIGSNIGSAVGGAGA